MSMYSLYIYIYRHCWIESKTQIRLEGIAPKSLAYRAAKVEPIQRYGAPFDLTARLSFHKTEIENPPWDPMGSFYYTKS